VTTDPIVGVLALQGAFREHVRRLEALDVAAVTVRTPAELASVGALIIPGGESTAMSRLAVDLGMLDPVAERIAAGMPTFGTCAGMIMLADELLDPRSGQRQFGGLHLTVRRNAFGRQVESFESDVSVPILGEPPFPAVFIRAPWVEAAGPEVEVLATIRRTDPSGHPADRIVAVRQGSVLATSFHPELTSDDRLHRLFLTMIEEDACRAIPSGPPPSTRRPSSTPNAANSSPN
jgi:5'-phosphate synthase pdxT subunit